MTGQPLSGGQAPAEPAQQEETDDRPLAKRQVALIDLLDRLLAGGAVIAGDLTLRIADVDLVRINLRAVISSINEQVPSPFALDTGTAAAAQATLADRAAADGPDEPASRRPWETAREAAPEEPAWERSRSRTGRVRSGEEETRW